MPPSQAIESPETPVEAVATVNRLIDDAVTDDNRHRVIPQEVERSLRAESGRSPPGGVVKMALLGDCLRVIESAVAADGQITRDEVEYVYPTLYTAASFLSKIRADYRAYEHPDSQGARRFLQFYRDDDGLFGKQCPSTRWLGLDICRRLAKETGDFGALDIYEKLVVQLMDEVIALGGVSAEERQAREELAEFITLRKELRQANESVGEGGEDPRVSAFCHPEGPAVFSATAHGHQVWERDPFDVETVHSEARRAFERLVDKVTAPSSGDRGRMLLVLGDSGAGKTHLMRAFRGHLHGQRAGYAGYMQMASRSEDYARYALVNLLDSLERKYDPPDVEPSGLMALSDAVTEAHGAIDAQRIESLRNGELEPGTDADFISELADELLGTSSFEGFDPDLLRAMLYLQRRDPRIKARVLKYLRCEELTDYDRRLLGGIAPRTDEDAPQRTIEELGRLMWAADGTALVLLVDQLEDVFNLDDSVDRFRRSLDVLRTLVERLPSAIVTVACLEDFYETMKQHLSRSIIDRLERDPEPVRLTSIRTLDEIQDIVAKRLEYLYDALGVRHHSDDPHFPFLPAQLEALAHLRTRDVLEWCRDYQQRCIAAGGLAEAATPGPTGRSDSKKERDFVEIEQAWNDFRTAFGEDPPENDQDLMYLLRGALEHCERELGRWYQVEAHHESDLLAVDAPGPEGKREALAVSMCNKATQGGGLLRQVEGLAQEAHHRIPVLVRCSEYPSNSKTKTAQRIGELVRDGARRIVVEDAEWRSIMAFDLFRREWGNHEAFDYWLREAKPLTQLSAIRELLALDRPGMPKTSAEGDQAQHPAPRESQPVRTVKTRAVSSDRPPAPSEPSGGQLSLGRTAGVSPKPVAVDPKQLTTHVSVLGSTGSGKTTLALRLLEQAMASGIPVLALDRKGDLAGYARPSWWESKDDDEMRDKQKRSLAEQLAVSLYTPGAPSGRALSIPVVPTGLDQLSSRDRNVVARHAASALGAMMGYGQTETDKKRRSVLAKAIELLGEATRGREVELEELTQFIDERDPSLVHAVGRLDTKIFGKLVDSLEMLRLERGELLSGGEPLDCQRLIHGAPEGKTAFNIISTKFLGDDAGIQFWVARLLVELSRWASRAPSQTLQALLFIDEADLYMPATAKPVTKEPLIDLLKRARSAGLGVVLATQNPGDLDYKSRDNILTWFLGKVTTSTARQKMQPLFAESRVNVSEQLATQGTGDFFMLHQGEATAMRADRSLLDPEQVPEDELLALAQRTAR